ncbi:MAG: replicative DNA helicase [Thermotogae bacterium]|nr:replicative DNA helicase [Thermotogota bacterium]
MAEELVKKIPPQNLDAEQALLGAMFIDPSIIADVMEICTVNDFYSESNRLIFEAIEKLYEENKGVDPVTVMDLLKKDGNLDKIGGAIYLSRLADITPTAANAEYYARIVRDKSILRHLISTGSRIVESAYEERDVEDILDDAEKSIMAIGEQKMTRSYESISTIVHRTFENIENVKIQHLSPDEHGIYVSGIPTGYPSLDAMTAGFHKSDLVIIAARPSVGKTALAINMVKEMTLKYNVAVAFFSLEMTKEQLAQRLLCSQGSVDLKKIRAGYLSDDEWNRLTNAASEFYNVHLVVDDSAGIDIRELRAKARRIKREYGLDLLIVDYLQLMRTRMPRENRQQEVSEISRSLKILARELDICVIAVSQLSRAVEQRENRRPRLSDLRESGAIEQDADLVMFLYRHGYEKSSRKENAEEDKEDNKPDETELIIGKQRNGPVGTVKLFFVRPYATFYEPDYYHSHISSLEIKGTEGEDFDF